MRKYTVALFCCLCLCVPTLAAPPSPAEWAYAAKIEGHTAKTDATLRDLYSQFRFPQLNVSTWKHKVQVTLAQVRAEAAQGQTFHAPPRFQPVQGLYSVAMMQYAEASRGMSVAIKARDIKSITHWTGELENAHAVMRRAVALLHTTEQQQT